MIYAVALTLAAILGYGFYKELKNAPEAWLCSYCHNEVIGIECCPYCGTKREE